VEKEKRGDGGKSTGVGRVLNKNSQSRGRGGKRDKGTLVVGARGSSGVVVVVSAGYLEVPCSSEELEMARASKSTVSVLPGPLRLNGRRTIPQYSIGTMKEMLRFLGGKALHRSAASGGQRCGGSQHAVTRGTDMAARIWERKMKPNLDPEEEKRKHKNFGARREPPLVQGHVREF